MKLRKIMENKLNLIIKRRQNELNMIEVVI